jgi:ABC-type antimicrobial peptide transport system permease subunit
MLYVPFAQVDHAFSEVQVRTATDPSVVAPAVYHALARFDTRLAVVGLVDARDRLDASIAGERLVTILAVIFGLLTLGLAAVGVYGLIAYVTVQRTGEIGIRMALGADHRRVRGLVLRDTLRVLVIGLVVGTPLAMAAARLLANQLYAVKPSDPLAVAVSVLTLSGAAIAAGYAPARRATRIDPAVALRAE